MYESALSLYYNLTTPGCYVCCYLQFNNNDTILTKQYMYRTLTGSYISNIDECVM